jgi:hypothetical protein
MNEIILFFAVAAVIIAAQFLMKGLEKPLLTYIRVFAAIGILILIWAFNAEGRLGVKIILSALMLSVLFKEYSNKKRQPNRRLSS